VCARHVHRPGQYHVFNGAFMTATGAGVFDTSGTKVRTGFIADAALCLHPFTRCFTVDEEQPPAFFSRNLIQLFSRPVAPSVRALLMSRCS